MDTPTIIYSPQIKLKKEDFEVEFDIDFSSDLSSAYSLSTSWKDKEIEIGIAEAIKAFETNDLEIDILNKRIDKLTNSADNLDYIIAVVSGILAGIVDSLWVGEFSLDRAKEWGSDKTNNFVKKIAKSQGYKGDNLEGSIRHLENKFPLSSDSNTKDFGGSNQHHLRDFAHHPTIIGLIFSMLTQFTGKAYGTKTSGSFIIEEVRNKNFIGKDLHNKFIFGTVFWFFHMVSDMAGSSSTPGKGTGLPGPLLSFAKEISSLKIFKIAGENEDINIYNNKIVRNLSLKISKIFNGTFFSERDSKGNIIKESVKRFDFRAELGSVNELGRQAIPIILNECIVRSFYFIRRLTSEIKANDINKLNELNSIEWENILPYKNRTIVRMLTIATGTFTVIDLGDAAIRGAVKSSGTQALFAKEFLLNVNFVGVGRFTIAVGTDAVMGISKEKRRNERIVLMSQQLHLLNTKVFYRQANSWLAAESTARTIEEVKIKMEETAVIAVQLWKANRVSMNNIGKYIDAGEKDNKGVFNEIIDILKWG